MRRWDIDWTLGWVGGGGWNIKYEKEYLKSMARFAAHELQSTLKNRTSVPEGLLPCLSPVLIIHNHYVQQLCHLPHLWTNQNTKYNYRIHKQNSKTEKQKSEKQKTQNEKEKQFLEQWWVTTGPYTFQMWIRRNIQEVEGIGEREKQCRIKCNKRERVPN